MSLGGHNGRNLEAIAFLALILSFSSFSFISIVSKQVACFPGDIGSTKCPVSAVCNTVNFALCGVWQNFPASCVSSDACELFGLSVYRGITRLISNLNDIGFQLQVDCLVPSNTVGATLQLQDATYNTATRTNSTNFANIAGATVLIDNSANNPCPGTLINSAPVFPASTSTASAQTLIFRVIVSVGGGGPGDNPRLSSVSVIQTVKLFNLENTYISGSPSTTGFTAAVTMIVEPYVNFVASFNWIATNSSATCTVFCTQDGTDSCTINTGFFSCTKAITFANAFVNSAPTVLVAPKTVQNINHIPAGQIPLFMTQVNTGG